MGPYTKRTTAASTTSTTATAATRAATTACLLDFETLSRYLPPSTVGEKSFSQSSSIQRSRKNGNKNNSFFFFSFSLSFWGLGISYFRKWLLGHAPLLTEDNNTNNSFFFILFYYYYFFCYRWKSISRFVQVSCWPIFFFFSPCFNN